MQNDKKAEQKNRLRLIAASGAAVLLVGLLLTLVTGGFQTDHTPVYGLYIKDWELFYSGLRKDQTRQVTEELLDPDASDRIASDSSGLEVPVGMSTTVSADGKWIFYPEQLDRTNYLTLYARRLDKPKAEAVKIDTEVLNYAASENAALVTYTRVGSGNLYQYQVKKGEKNKLAGDVAEFHVSEDGTKILCLSDKKELYLLSGQGKKETLDSDVEALNKLSDDFKTVYYEKENAFYKLKIGEEPEQIADDLYQVVWVYDSGEAYYIREKQREKTLSECIEDDLLEQDAAMEAPSRPEEPNRGDYFTERSYESACEDYADALGVYAEELEAYDAKLERDALRAQMGSRTLYVSSFALYYYDGMESVMLTEDYATYGFAAWWDLERPQFVYGETAGKNVKLSEIDNLHQAENSVLSAINRWKKAYLVQGDEITQLDMNDPCSITFSRNGEFLYYVDNVSETDLHGELYRLDISAKTIGDARLYEENVYSGWMQPVGEDRVAYFRDVDEQCGTMYVGKKQVDTEVQIWNLTIGEDKAELFYYREWKPGEKNRCGTLMYWNGRKTETITDEAVSYERLHDGTVLYLRDYDWNEPAGDLYLWRNGKSVLVDSHVNAIVHLFVTEQNYLVY